MKPTITKVIDNTIYETVVTCPTKYNYRHKQHLVPSVEAIYFTFGKALHKALELWYGGSDIDKCLSTIDELYTDKEVALEEYRTAERARKVFLQYVQEYANDPMSPITTTADGQEIPWLETNFAIPIHKFETDKAIYDILYSGNFDGIFRWSDNTYVVDHKTCSEMGDSYFDQFKPSNQMTGYVFAAKQLSRKSIVGVVINAICVRKPLVRDYKGAKPRNEFARRIISYRDDDIEEWLLDMKNTIEWMVSMEESNYYPRFRPSCVGKYGKCTYHKVCSAPQRARQNVIDTEYVISEWNPLNRDGDE